MIFRSSQFLAHETISTYFQNTSHILTLTSVNVEPESAFTNPISFHWVVMIFIGKSIVFVFIGTSIVTRFHIRFAFPAKVTVDL